MLANVLLAAEVCQKLSGPTGGNICTCIPDTAHKSHAEAF